ncbi:hypothetical protein AC1031_002428 [Aphanomyces cochlioides]|nr:hypothetical protein AC1031_002428 [Aphanomyces cochlioides]
MRAFVPISPLPDETKFEYVWANRMLLRIALDATSWPHNYAKFQERVVNFAREREGLNVRLAAKTVKAIAAAYQKLRAVYETPPNYAQRGDTRGRTGPSTARQSARRQPAPRSPEPEAKRSRREATRSPSRDRPKCVQEQDLVQLRDDFVEVTCRLERSEMEVEKLRGALDLEREKRREFRSRFEKMSQLSE